jgi:glucosamine--fructose-6-phosphate aminotransferase (isomerizing)
MHAGRSLVPTSTKTFVTSVATLDLLWLSLLTAQGVQEAHGVRKEVRTLANAVEQSLAQAQRQVAAAAERLARCERVFVLGAGPLFPVAQEAALVFKEVAILPAEAVQTREMAQGTTAVVDERCGVVVTSPPGRGQEVVEAIVAECAGLGAAIVEVGPSSTTMRIEVRCHDLLSPLVYSSPLFMLASHVGSLRGVDSDHPHWEGDYLRMTRRSVPEMQGQNGPHGQQTAR